jgi:hypothetical protein
MTAKIDSREAVTGGRSPGGGTGAECRRMNAVGDMIKFVVPSRQGVSSFNTT